MPMQIFAIFHLFGDGHSNSCGIIPHYGFNLHFCNDCGGGGLVAKLCPTLCDPIDGSPPGSAQTRTLEWVAISFSNA